MPWRLPLSFQRWQVDCSAGENRLLATGASQAEAWYRATVLARELGQLAPGSPSAWASPYRP
jgi:hypothetical protein